MPGTYPPKLLTRRTVPRPVSKSSCAWRGTRTLRYLREAAKQLATWSMERETFTCLGEYLQPPGLSGEAEVEMLLNRIAFEADLGNGATQPRGLQHTDEDALWLPVGPYQQADTESDVHRRLAVVIYALVSIATNEHALRALRRLKPRDKRLAIVTLQLMAEMVGPKRKTAGFA